MENQQLEWKEIWHDEHLKWICGFANTQGGTLVIGKNDKGETVGVKNVRPATSCRICNSAVARASICNAKITNDEYI